MNFQKLHNVMALLSLISSAIELQLNRVDLAIYCVLIAIVNQLFVIILQKEEGE